MIVTDVVPSILPNCPKYLSKPEVCHRESVDMKRERLENARIEEAIQKSLESDAAYRRSIAVKNFQEFISKLEGVTFIDNWIVKKHEDFVNFIFLQETPRPIVKCYITVKDNLELSVHDIDNVNLKSLGNMKFPFTLTDINQFDEVVQIVTAACSDENEDLSVKKIVSLIVSKLCLLSDRLPEKKTIIDFLSEQVTLLDVSRMRYSWELTLFCGLIHSISPHAYKFIRNFGNLYLPSSSTLRRVCNKYCTDPRHEQNSSNLLSYVNSKFNVLAQEDKTIVLMMDEIHLKPYMDFKSGNIVGQAFNSEECATSAHVFMISSIRSSYKDVVHILPVKKIDSLTLFNFVKVIIIGLEKIGFEVLAIVSDNNAINKKTMSFFSQPPEILNEYKHPCDPSRPLFFVIDPVHLLKNIRNNWINKKPHCKMVYPHFENHNNLLRVASFDALKELHRLEEGSLLKYGYGLTLKALFPSSLERQNVKLALQIFSGRIVTALNEIGPLKNLENWQDTACYIDIICKWWDVVNVKSNLKGKRLRNTYQEPITRNSDHITTFLNDFLKWLDRWEVCEEVGKLTKETHGALKLTTSALLNISQYCLNVKSFNYFLCGKIQTDHLEDRFGKYRQYSGSQYHVSVRQIFESESKIRMQDILPLGLKSETFGEFQISVREIQDTIKECDDSVKTFDRLSIPKPLANNCVIGNDYLDSIKDTMWPVLTYIAGYAAYSVSKKIKCNYCKAYLTSDTGTAFDSLIDASNRGGLCYPSGDVVACACCTFAIVQKLISKENEHIFLTCSNQRQVVTSLAIENLYILEDIFIGYNCQSHNFDNLIHHIIYCTSNILLNNYCKLKNDVINKKTMPQSKRFKPS